MTSSPDVHAAPSSLSLPERLSAVLIGLVPGRPSAFDELRALYAPDIVFRDPIQEVRGLDAFISMNERLLKRMRSLTWKIETMRGDDDVVVLEWTMSGVTKLGPKVRVEGMTRARARGGRIFDHRDYWDLGELATSALPGGPRLLRAILSPFA